MLTTMTALPTTTTTTKFWYHQSTLGSDKHMASQSLLMTLHHFLDELEESAMEDLCIM